MNNDLPLDSENLTVQIYVLCPNFKNYNHPSESTNSDVAGIRSALVCAGVLGPGISGTFLIYLHSASKTHSRIGVCFIQSIKQQTIQVYNYLSFETSPQGQEKRTTDCRVSEKLHENNYLQGIRPVNYCERSGSRRLSLTPLDPLIFPHDMSSFPDLYLHAHIIIF